MFRNVINAVMRLLIQYRVIQCICSVKRILIDTPASLRPRSLYPLLLPSPAVSQCILTAVSCPDESPGTDIRAPESSSYIRHMKLVWAYVHNHRKLNLKEDANIIN